jgi:hypothetical protein
MKKGSPLAYGFLREIQQAYVFTKHTICHGGFIGCLISHDELSILTNNGTIESYTNGQCVLPVWLVPGFMVSDIRKINSTVRHFKWPVQLGSRNGWLILRQTSFNWAFTNGLYDCYSITIGIITCIIIGLTIYRYRGRSQLLQLLRPS